MRRTHLLTVLLLAPVVAFSAVLFTGCGSSETSSGGSASGKEKDKDKGKGEMTEVAGDYKGVLKGKVTLTGDMPDLDALNKTIGEAIKKSTDPCLQGASPEESGQQTWAISKDNGVANVVVFIMPAGKKEFFKVDMAKKTWEDEAKINQPHCAFMPHVQVLFPKYYNPATKKRESTKQTLTVTNQATFNHNTQLKYEGGFNKPIAKNTTLDVDLSEFPLNQDVEFGCTIHGWMKGHLWAFEHPYATVTKPDGTYEIKNVPVGATVQVYAWHEADGYITPSLKDGGEKLELKQATTTKNFELKVK
jgi:hypothetical protein